MLRPAALAPSSLRHLLLVLAALVLPACASSGPTAPTLDQRLLGVWVDEGGSVVTIAAGADGYEIGVVDSDGEVFDVVETTYENGVLAWVYDVPSTGYRVTHRTTDITPGRVGLSWENQTGASGTDALVRRE